MDYNYYLKLHKSGKVDLAEKGYRKLLKEKIVNGNLLASLANICQNTGRKEEALSIYLNSIKIDPLNLLALNNLGLLFLEKEEYLNAKKYLLKSIKVKKNSKCLFLLGIINTHFHQYNEAILNYKECIKNESNPAASCNLGNIFFLLEDMKNAKKYLLDAIKTDPNMDSAHNSLGQTYLAIGEVKKAKKSILKAININPKNYKAHYALSIIIDYKENNQLIKVLQQNLNASSTDDERIYLEFALGKAFKDINNYELSFKHYKNANFLKRLSINYSYNLNEELFNRIKKIFTKKNIQNLSKYGYLDNSSIFIVGMPRSGTSLIEQVIASHSKVHGAGETNTLYKILNKYFINDGRLLELNNLDNKIFNDAGKEYVTLMKNKSRNKKFIIDKLPINFRWIGLINIILPEAKIINCTRNPYDTCLSIFENFFHIRGNEYTFNLKEIANYYNLYSDLLNYWKKIIHKNFFEINYEEFIYNQKNNTKKLLEYCSLAWEDQCMNFHLTKRTVRTSSDNQVRQKIYTQSINKWKKYKEDLNDLMKIIDQH